MKILSTLLMILLFSTCTHSQNKPVVIAHRGASGYLPEHTLEAKAMAHAMNVDYLEQDIVLTKDSIPVVIHDIHLDEVSDVSIKFPDRKREDERYYAIDFTLEELKTLNLSERFNRLSKKAIFPTRYPVFKGNFTISTLTEEIEFIQALNKTTGKNIGIYLEIKEPTFHKIQGYDITKIVLEVLTKYGYTSTNDNCILQCFDAKELERVRKELHSNLFLTQLLEHPVEENQMENIATYADAIGPWYKLCFQKENDKIIMSNLVNEAHKSNLKVHAYTFRKDQLDTFDSFNELLQSAKLAGIDGFFSDFPDLVIDYFQNND